jgi:glucose-6-phosphate isomerase
VIILPYKDHYDLFSKYMRQLVTGSLGKEKDLDGKTINQGVAVFGNKGSTYQHSYVKQLREVILNLFVTFIEIHRDHQNRSMIIDSGVTSGDYLQGFLLVKWQVLRENSRECITLSLQYACKYSVGLLIALLKRAVGFYATLINLNAYPRPGIETGKKVAAAVISLQTKALNFLAYKYERAFTASQIATGIGAPGEAETLFKVCEHAAANPDHGIRKIAGKVPFEATYLTA